MGEYEPDDSRDVTLKPGHEPGGIERTGPHEQETREDARSEPGERQRQERERAVEAGSAARPDRWAERDDPQATFSPAGDPRPEYDQYEVNQAGSINKRAEPGRDSQDESRRPVADRGDDES